MTERFIDVHVFDGRCKPTTIPEYTAESRRAALEYYERVLRDPDAKALIRMIQTDPPERNWDYTERIYTPDLLCDIINHMTNPDFVQVLNEQLGDCYRLGQCPQGRVKRILQCKLAFDE